MLNDRFNMKSIGGSGSVGSGNGNAGKRENGNGGQGEEFGGMSQKPPSSTKPDLKKPPEAANINTRRRGKNAHYSQ